jgi:hypothetical protein
MIRATILLVAFLCSAAGALAQEAADPAQDLFEQGLVAPTLDFTMQPPTESFAVPAPYAPSLTSPGGAPGARRFDLVLEARLVAEGEPIPSGIIWRIFGTQPGIDGSLPLISEVHGGTTTVHLASGEYFVHAAFGRAALTKRVTIADDDQMEALVLDAGGLKIDSVVGEDKRIDPGLVSCEILQENENGEMVTVVPNAAPGRILRLSAGTYHAISRYGDVNAIVRADIEVEPGKLTEATMRHTGAEVTLKLVSEEGGEALANTSWAVTTQDGTTVHESIGAFPSIVLASGGYTAVATHQNRIYSRDFTVETGVDRDIEVRLLDLVRPETTPANPPAIGSD